VKETLAKIEAWHGAKLEGEEAEKNGDLQEEKV